MNAPTNPHARKLVLIVDDFDGSAEMLAEMVELECGHDAAFAKDGLEALEIAAVRRPDFVVLDIDMPRLNGVETAKELRKRYAEKCPFLVAFSGGAKLGSPEDRSVFDQVLNKPADTSLVIKLACRLGC